MIELQWELKWQNQHFSSGDFLEEELINSLQF